MSQRSLTYYPPSRRREPSRQSISAAVYQRTRFAAICKAVNERRKDLSKVAADLAAFNAQKDTAGGYKTMRQYLWHICAAEIGG